MYLLPKSGTPRIIPTKAREVFDVSGAGDTVIAVSLMALASGASCYEAAELANYAAGVVVGKLGTAVCTKDELLKSLKATLIEAIEFNKEEAKKAAGSNWIEEVVSL